MEAELLVVTDARLNEHEKERVDTTQEGQTVLKRACLEGRVCDSVVHVDAYFGEPGRVSILGEL